LWGKKNQRTARLKAKPGEMPSRGRKKEGEMGMALIKNQKGKRPEKKLLEEQQIPSEKKKNVNERNIPQQRRRMLILITKSGRCP